MREFIDCILFFVWILPQELMQCASSMAKRHIWDLSCIFRRIFSNESLAKPSGVTYNSFILQLFPNSSSVIFCFRLWFRVLLNKTARIPKSHSPFTWFSISAMRGETTTHVPFKTRAGIWKQRDFPAPVGINTKQSKRWRMWKIISSWFSLKPVVILNTFFLLGCFMFLF